MRPRTLLAIAAAAGVYYYILPELAGIGSSWRSLQSAHWIWLPVVIAFSVLTYLASAISLQGSVTIRLPFWPTVLTQGASSFVNRVSPANVGGMALNVRYLQKSGVEPSAGVAAVGVNALAGGTAHAVLLVIFFSLAGRGLTQAFKLPSSSKLLVILAVVAAVIGIVMATRQGRNFAARKLLPGLRSSLTSLGRVARSPVKLALLFGGSALVTLAYIGGLVASVEAFGGGAGIVQIGAVYMASSLVAAASPTPGGLGAIEALPVAGLTGIGIPSGTGRVRGAHLPAGHLLAARAARLALLAPAAAHGLRVGAALLCMRAHFASARRLAGSPARPAARDDQSRRRVDGESQRHAARDVEREMRAHVDPGQPHQGDGAQGQHAAPRAEPGQGGDPEGDGHGGVPGQIPETGGVPAAAAGPGQHGHRPGPPHYLLDQLGQCPGAGAAGQQPRRQLAVSGQPRRSGRRGHGAEGAGCMTTQAGRYSASGRPLTAWKALVSQGPTRSWRTAPAVASSAAMPTPSRARGSASTSRSSTGPTISRCRRPGPGGQQRVSRRKSVPVSRIPRMSTGAAERPLSEPCWPWRRRSVAD